MSNATRGSGRTPSACDALLGGMRSLATASQDQDGVPIETLKKKPAAVGVDGALTSGGVNAMTTVARCVGPVRRPGPRDRHARRAVLRPRRRVDARGSPHSDPETRLPQPAPGEPWRQGTERDYLKGLLAYWVNGLTGGPVSASSIASLTVSRRSTGFASTSYTNGPAAARAS